MLKNRKNISSVGSLRTAMRLTILSVFVVLALSFSSCDRTRNDKGYEYFPDMAHSLAYETYAPNPIHPDQGMLTPPEGTVARGFTPYPFPATPEGRDQAGIELTNPFESEPDVLARGKEMYGIFCQQCHGTLGDGKGSLYTSGKYVIAPANLIRDDYKDKPSGDIYHVITQGFGVMGAHGAQIHPDDRWKIVSYVKTVLQSK